MEQNTFIQQAYDQRAFTGHKPTAHRNSSNLVFTKDSSVLDAQGSSFGILVAQDATNALRSTVPMNNTFIHSPRVINSSAQSCRTPGAQIFADVAKNYYGLPAHPALNFTLVEIIAILPHWFNNFDIAYRFENNGLTTAVHWAILLKHRSLDLSPAEAARHRELITSHHRRAIRSRIPHWTKLRHRVPQGWSTRVIGVEGFMPDAANQKGYWCVPSVPLKSLANGLKTMPVGPDAGDLTRAVQFAIKNKKVGPMGQLMEYMFPDDIHVVLERAGRTVVTMDHIDTIAILRYGRTGVRSLLTETGLSMQNFPDSLSHTTSHRKGTLSSVDPFSGKQNVLKTNSQEAHRHTTIMETPELSTAYDCPSNFIIDKFLADLIAQPPLALRGSGISNKNHQHSNTPQSDNYSQATLEADIVGFPEIPDVCLFAEDLNNPDARRPELSACTGPPTRSTMEDMDVLLETHQGYVY